MVKGIFCHDLPIYKDRNGIYCCTTLTDDVLNRYLNMVDELIVATRVYDLNCTWKEAHQERITLQNVCFLDIPNLNKPCYVFTRIPKAKKIIQDAMQECELVFIKGGTIASISAGIAKKLNKKYLVENAGCGFDSFWYHSLMGKLIAPFVELDARRIVRDAAFVMYVTDHWLQNRYPTRGIAKSVSDVVIDSMDDCILEHRICRINKRKNNDVLVLGTAGGLNSKIKGQRYVIEAMAKLAEEYNIRYEMVGTGNEGYLRNIAHKYHIEDKIVFKGEINHTEVLEWMDSLDIYIQPSLQEGLPMALVEAMSRACPCIGSTAGGIPELLESDAIFNKGKVKDLVRVLREFYHSDWNKHIEHNFKRAKDFQKEILDKKRADFFMEYKRYALGEKTVK